MGPETRLRVDSGTASQHATLDIIGLPAIEIYRTTQVGARDGLARVAIAIPVATRGKR